MTIAREYAEHCAGLSYDDLPGEAVEYVKKLVLDTLGNAVGGYYWADSGDVMAGAARDLGSGGDATVLATGERLSPADAALANGSLAHSLDYDNRHSRGSLHVGSSVVTAAITAAEVADADGEAFLEGVVAGYDVAARLGMACNPRSSHDRGFHPTGTCGTFGATAAVGTVYGFDADDLETAFAVNGSQASGSYQCSLTGGWNKRIHPGLAARNAFASVSLTENGFAGPTAPIEGELGFLRAYADPPRPGRATEALGEVYEVENATIKPYPFGTFAHVPVSLLLELVDEEGIDPGEISEIAIEIPTSGAAFFGRSAGDGHPTTPVGAQFDMSYAAALAVAYGEAGLRAFHDALDEEYPGEFGRLMDATTTIGSDELEEYLPEHYPARVTVRTRERTYERFREWVEGTPERPMPWDALEAKFADLTAEFDAEKRAGIVDRVEGIESLTGRELVAPFRS